MQGGKHTCRSKRHPRLLRSKSRHCSSRMRAILTAFQTIRGTYTPDMTRQFDRNDGRLHTGGLRCAAINTRSGHETHSIWRTRGGEAGRAAGRSDPALCLELCFGLLRGVFWKRRSGAAATEADEWPRLHAASCKPTGALGTAHPPPEQDRLCRTQLSRSRGRKRHAASFRASAVLQSHILAGGAK